jgi:hypothetical protein
MAGLRGGRPSKPGGRDDAAWAAPRLDADDPMKEIPADFVAAPRTLKQVIWEFLNFQLYLHRKENSPGFDYHNYYQTDCTVLVGCRTQ